MAIVEEWNGSSWTEIADLNTARQLGGSSSNSPSTNFIVFSGRNAGNTADLAITEEWDGSSWTEVADMSTARKDTGGTGTAALALAIGGRGPPVKNATEEWSLAQNVEIITD